MKTKLGRQVVYVVHEEGRTFARVHKNLKSVAEWPEYQISIHTLYKHDFNKEAYDKGKYRVVEQMIM